MSFNAGINVWLLAAFIFSLCLFIYRYLKQTYKVLEKLGIPGPKPVWIFGNVLEFKDKNILSVFDEWKKQYGDVYGFYEGFRAGIVVNDVEMAKDILSRHFDNFHVRTSYRPFVYYPDSLRLIEISGEHWKHQRAVVNKMLRCSGNLKRVSEKMEKAAENMTSSLKEDWQLFPEDVNISKYVDGYVVEGILRVVLNLDDEALSTYRDEIYKYILLSNWSASADNEATGLARLFPSLTPLLKLADREHKRYCEKIVALLRKFIKTALANQNNNTVESDDHVSLLSFLLSTNVLSRDIDGSLARRELNEDETISHVLTLLSEMHATTAAAIQFVLYELALNQNIQQRLYEEICQNCGKGEKFTLSHTQNFEYFDQIFNEAIRLHPIAPGLSRVCTQSCKIRNINFQEGMVVRVMTSTLYKDENIFPDPETFNPERFTKANRETRHQYSFLPFGQGPRMCPGQKLAMIKVRYAVISIIKSFTVSTSKNTEIPLKEAFRPSLTPANGVTLKMTPRK